MSLHVASTTAYLPLSLFLSFSPSGAMFFVCHLYGIPSVFYYYRVCRLFDALAVVVHNSPNWSLFTQLWWTQKLTQKPLHTPVHTQTDSKGVWQTDTKGRWATAFIIISLAETGRGKAIFAADVDKWVDFVFQLKWLKCEAALCVCLSLFPPLSPSLSVSLLKGAKRFSFPKTCSWPLNFAWQLQLHSVSSVLAARKLIRQLWCRDQSKFAPAETSASSSCNLALKSCHRRRRVK